MISERVHERIKESLQAAKLLPSMGLSKQVGDQIMLVIGVDIFKGTVTVVDWQDGKEPYVVKASKVFPTSSEGGRK